MRLKKCIHSFKLGSTTIYVCFIFLWKMICLSSIVTLYNHTRFDKGWDHLINRLNLIRFGRCETVINSVRSVREKFINDDRSSMLIIFPNPNLIFLWLQFQISRSSLYFPFLRFCWLYLFLSKLIIISSLGYFDWSKDQLILNEKPQLQYGAFLLRCLKSYS